MSDARRVFLALLAGVLIVVAIAVGVSLLPNHKNRTFRGPVPSSLRR